MYQSAVRQRSQPQGTSVHSPQRQQNRDRNKIRLLQLSICLLLFLAVFVGRGVFPSELGNLESTVHQLLTAEPDMGGAVKHVLETIEQHSGAASFFAGISEKILVTPTETHTISGDDHALSIPQAKNLITAEQTKLSSCTIPEDIANHYFVTSLPQIVHTTTEPTSKEPECVPSVPAAGTVLLKADYNGQPLPEHYTMDHISLGPLDTTTPVLGRLNSCYGYRDHPVDGVYQFHGGLDIGAQTGDPILAFASGTVDYIGENSSYGLYLQLDHGNGIKSFYAHCSSVSVKKGQSVSLGEKIAEVGSTGTATGPHLHFELKYQGLHVDPAYYVDCISSQ